MYESRDFMRDQQRITQILEIINIIWLKYPDLRFNQLIYNLQNGFSLKDNDAGKINEIQNDGFLKVGFDLFYLEDDEFIKYLNDVVANGL